MPFANRPASMRRFGFYAAQPNLAPGRAAVRSRSSCFMTRSGNSCAIQLTNAIHNSLAENLSPVIVSSHELASARPSLLAERGDVEVRPVGYQPGRLPLYSIRDRDRSYLRYPGQPCRPDVQREEAISSPQNAMKSTVPETQPLSNIAENARRFALVVVVVGIFLTGKFAFSAVPFASSTVDVNNAHLAVWRIVNPERTFSATA